MDLPDSPCVRNCCLDPADDVCLGCFRSIDEIMGWHDADGPQRLIILARTLQRREAHHLRYGLPWPPRDSSFG